MPTTHEVVRRVFPDASNDECGHLLWNNTGYPSFWATGNPERDILHSLRTLKRNMARGWVICDSCNGKAVLPKGRPTVCRGCARVMLRAAKGESQ
jgi:hypothetical protein